jgi:hypothetical protein
MNAAQYKPMSSSAKQFPAYVPQPTAAQMPAAKNQHVPATPNSAPNTQQIPTTQISLAQLQQLVSAQNQTLNAPTTQPVLTSTNLVLPQALSSGALINTTSGLFLLRPNQPVMPLTGTVIDWLCLSVIG